MRDRQRTPPRGRIHVGHTLATQRGSHPAGVRTAAVAVATALLVAVLGDSQAYWLCVPAVLLVCARTDSRAGTAAAAAVVMAAAAAPLVTLHGWRSLPGSALALLVPAASVAVTLAMRERLESEREAMRRSALTDPLTGVANRRSLLYRIEYEIARHNRARRPFGVVMIDLDGFKQLNDRFGHPAGDDLLRDVAAAIMRVVRDQDTVARMGGDEFCVLAPETDPSGTHQLAERVLEAVASVTAGIDQLAASAGTATFPLDGKSPTELLGAADELLLDAKRRRGRPRARRAA